MSTTYELTKDIDHYLGVLSKLYGRDGSDVKLAIIVNSEVRTQDDWTYDNWNGGTSGHALFLSMPEDLFFENIRNRDKLQAEIRDDLNQVHSFQNESFAEVFLEMRRAGDSDWRATSGALRSSRKSVSGAATSRIWGEGYRVFLSHKVSVKKKTAALKDTLKPFGITCFVAHEDIHPTQAWQDEIESALSTMDAFIALMTKDFHESLWTDQEVGFALGRNVPIIAVRLGQDPYGFIGKFQALQADWEDAPLALAKLLSHQASMVDAYIEALAKCGSFDEGNKLSSLLASIPSLSEQQGDRITAVFNENYELRNSFGFNGRNSSYGGGLPELLKRKLGRTVLLDKQNRLTAESP